MRRPFGSSRTSNTGRGRGVGQPLPPFQKWKVTRAIGAIDFDSYLISSQAHPDKVLQPADFNQPGSPIVLSEMVRSGGAIHRTLSAWKIPSPLLSSGGTKPPDAVSERPAPPARRESRSGRPRAGSRPRSHR